MERDKIRNLVSQAVREEIGGSGSPTDPASDEGGTGMPALIDESIKSVITEDDLKGVQPGSKLLVKADAIITPAAADLIRHLNLEIRYRSRLVATSHNRLIAVGADHGGFAMKEELKKLLGGAGYRYRDFGTYDEQAVDYPDFAHAVARAVADGVCDLGIIVDGAGIGSCMTANKVPGVRAALCYDEASARNSREHNYANVLTLGGRLISVEAMRSIVGVWLSTPEGESRHGKRVAKIMAVEKQYLR